MKKLIISALILIGLVSNAQVQVAWYNYPGGVAVATDASNNVYTANWDYNAGGDITLTKRDASGNILWEVPYNNTDMTRHEVATWVETDGAGNILVSGTIRSGYSNPVNANSLLMKFDPAGNLLWRVVYETDFDGSSTKKCLVDAQNNIYVLGLGNNGTGMRTKVKKFSPGGATIWSYFDLAGIGAPINFKFTPDNNIVISSRGIAGSMNGYAKIDLNGNLIWSYAGINSLTVGDIAGDSFGNTYIINGEYVVSNAGSIINKLSPSGAVIWSQTNSLKGNRVEVGTDNNPVISGYPAVGYGAAFMKYSMNGDVLWQNLDADGASYALLAHAQMKLDALNAAYLAGSTMSQMAVCKVNGDGTSAWTASTSSGYPTCIDFGTDNSVFVVGGTTARFTQTGSVTPPATPTNLTAIASGTSVINLTWTDNATTETSFVLQRSLSAGSGFVTIATLPSNINSYSNTGLNSATTYHYKVQATNSGGGSAWSNIANATTAAGPPIAPTNLIATAAGASTINLIWTDNASNETSFVLQRSLSGSSGFATIATIAANTISYSNTGLNGSTTYFYRVHASNSNGNSAWSNVANATTASAGPPAAPSNLTAVSAGCNSIKLTWLDNSSNETNFELRRSTSQNGTYTTVATLPANTTIYTNTGLTKGRKYYYKVRAANAAGNSAWSNTANAIPVCPKSSLTGELSEAIKLFPNPASGGFVNLILPAETKFPVILQIYSLTGQKVLEKNLSDYSNTIETLEMKNGMYFLSVYSNGNLQKMKLQINK